MSDNQDPTTTKNPAVEEAFARLGEVMKPYDAGAARIQAAWNRLAQPYDGDGCVRCAEHTAASVNGVCFACFDKANQTAPAVQEARAEQVAVHCNFCGRDAETIRKGGGSAVAGQGAIICNTCASAAAGCAGARDATEARAMMAQSAMQAEAVASANALMKKSTSLALSDEPGAAARASDMAALAETHARIARGGK